MKRVRRCCAFHNDDQRTRSRLHTVTEDVTDDTLRFPSFTFQCLFFSRVSLLCWRMRAGVPPVPKGHDRAPSAWFGFSELGCKPPQARVMSGASTNPLGWGGEPLPPSSLCTSRPRCHEVPRRASRVHAYSAELRGGCGGVDAQRFLHPCVDDRDGNREGPSKAPTLFAL